MYVRAKKIGNGYYNYLVKSIREGKKVHQKYIKYLGKTVMPVLNFSIKEKLSELGLIEQVYKEYSNGDIVVLWDRDKDDFLLQQYSKKLMITEFINSCLEQGFSIEKQGDLLDKAHMSNDFLSDSYDLGDRGYYDAVVKYTATESGCAEIQDYLRHGTQKYVDPSVLKNMVSRLDKFTKLFSSRKKMTLWHGANMKYRDNLSEGDTFTDKGFFSASTNKERAMRYEQGVLFRLNTKKGQTFGVGNYGEREYILGRNNTFKVTKIINKKDFVLMDLEIIGGVKSGKKRK